jgi:tagatose 1,6-diphosphate aldolase
MDQRGSLKKALAKEKGGDVSDKDMEEFKIHVTEVLTQARERHPARPRVGPAASKRRAKGSGLLMAYEKTGYDANTPGRLPDLLDHWSVRRLKEAGADCIKILLYYTPFDPKHINELKHAWVERIGDECRANDIPFFSRVRRLRGRRRREGPRVREEEARHRHGAWRSSRRTGTAWTS